MSVPETYNPNRIPKTQRGLKSRKSSPPSNL